MSLERKMIKYAKKRDKIEKQIAKYKEIICSLQREINSLELEAKDWEAKGLENLEVCSNYETCKLMLGTATDTLKKVENKLDKKVYEFNMLDKTLDDWQQRLEEQKEL